MSKISSIVDKKTWSSHGYKIIVYQSKDKDMRDMLVIKPIDELEPRPEIDYEPKTGMARLTFNCDISSVDIEKMKSYLNDAEQLIEELKKNKELTELDLP